MDSASAERTGQREAQHLGRLWVGHCCPPTYAQTGWENSPLVLHNAHFRWGICFPSMGEQVVGLVLW